jgi:ABC-type branched-subunit amino acid transport system permease subunit
MTDNPQPESLLQARNLSMVFGGLVVFRDISLDEMGKVCLIVIIGGLGKVYGPVLGSFFVVIVAEFLRGWVGGYSLLIFATIMILAVRFVRGGFMEIIQVISPHLRDKYLMLIVKHKMSPGNVPK